MPPLGRRDFRGVTCRSDDFDVQYNRTVWGISLVGRAPALQAGGQRFESAILHHFLIFSTEST
jgi:hypothetical protein